MSSSKTQCPACDTQFFVSAEQLAAHGGMVRCGQCSQVFNASEQIAEDLTGAMSTADDDLDQLFAPDPVSPKPATQPIEPMLIDTTDEQSDLQLNEAFAQIDEEPDAFLLDEPTEEFNQTAVNLMSVGDYEGLDMTGEAKQLNDETQDFLSGTSEQEQMDEEMLDEDLFLKAVAGSNPEVDESHAALAADPDLTRFLSGIGANTAQFNSLGSKAGKTQEMMANPAIHKKPSARTSINKPPRKVGKTLFWGFLCLLAIAGLFAQYVYFNFDKLSQNPAYAPKLAEACASIGCVLPKADANLVVLDELDWFTNEQNLPQVRFTVGSRSEVPMLLPMIEMTLYRGEESLGATLLSPDEYLVGTYTRLPTLQPLDAEVIVENLPQSFDRVELRPLY